MIETRIELHKLLNELGIKIGVEVGVQGGLYSKYLLENTKIKLYLVDIWKHLDNYFDIANVSDAEQEQVLLNCKELLSPYMGRFEIIRELSINASKLFSSNFFDFIYLDAGHSYKSISEDLIAWYPKLKIGGLMSGHDFVDGENLSGSEFGVKSAVLDFIKDKNIKLFVTNEDWPTWYWIK